MSDRDAARVARHRRVKEIFLAATAAPPEQRPSLLERECADDRALRHEVEALLAEEGRPLFDRRDSRAPRPQAAESQAAESQAAESRAAESRAAETLPAVTLAMPSAGSAEPQSRFAPGSLLAGRYRIVELLGSGGMGEVYKARDEVLDQTVSLKFLHLGVRPAGAALGSLLEEVRLARRVSHPNVCRVFDVGSEGDETFLSMEYVDGEDLASLVARIGRLPVDTVCRIARQLAAGLAAAHAQGVIHRDLKPSNILLDGQGQVRIADFGTATLFRPRRGRAGEPLTGTPAYMSPEQLQGQPATPKSDLYALGLVLFEALTGRRVFEGQSFTDYFEAHTTQPPPPPSSMVGSLDPELENLILACLEKDPARRPASALAVAAAIPGVDPLRLAAEVGVTPPPEIVAAAGRGLGLRPSRATLLVLALAALQVAFLALAKPSFRLAQANLSKPPQVLADRAQQILQQLGQRLPVGDRAWGFFDEPRATGPRGAVQFWYRQSPEPLVPWEMGDLFFSGGQVGFWDPPQDEPGMVQLVLDPTGRLVSLSVVPGAEATPSPPVGQPTDDSTRQDAVDQLFALAELKRTAFRSVDADFEPEVFADTRLAFEQATAPRTRVEIALLDGLPVHFDQRPTGPRATAREEALEDRLDFLFQLELAFAASLFVLALVLLRSQLARGDVRGGRRLAVFVFAARLLAFAALASHVPAFEPEILLVTSGIAIALLEAALVWISYVALEPFVRKRWPQTLIAWNRLIVGRWRDPLVGGAVLVGLAVGSAWAVLNQIDALAPGWLGLRAVLPPIDTLPLDATIAARAAFGELLDVLLWAIYDGVTALLLLVFLRYAARRPWIAATLFVVLYGALETVNGNQPAISWLTLGLPLAASSILLLVRFGLPAMIAALLAESMLFAYPTTLDTTAWYFGTGLLGPALTLGLGLAAYWTARGTAARHAAR